MNEVDTGRISYHPIPQINPELDSDVDDPRWLSQEPAPDPVREFDAVLEIIADADLSCLLSQMVALETHLNEPYALFPGERDSQGTDVTEYPFE